MCYWKGFVDVSSFSGTRLSQRDIEVVVHGQIKKIVNLLWIAQIDPEHAIRKLTDLFVRAGKAQMRVQAREKE